MPRSCRPTARRRAGARSTPPPEHAVAGHVATALALLEQAEPRIEPALAPALARLRGNLAMRRGEPHAAQRILQGEAERALAAGDHASAATLLLESSIGYTMIGDPDGMFTTLQRASASAAQVGGPAELVARIMLAVSGMVVGRARDGAARELEQIEPLLGRARPGRPRRAARALRAGVAVARPRPRRADARAG